MNEETLTDSSSKTRIYTAQELALKYARLGLKVFPVQKDKKPLAGTHGFKDATDNIGIIVGWFKDKNDGRMVASATGSASNIWVLDVDGPTQEKPGKRGFETLKKVLEHYGKELPETMTVCTPGGRHFYFKWRDGSPKSRADIWGQGSGVDVRGDGGYIVLPGNVRDDEMYVIEDGKSFNDIAEAPEWLEELCGSREKMDEVKAWLEGEKTGQSQKEEKHSTSSVKTRKGRMKKSSEDLAQHFCEDVLKLREAKEGSRNSLLHDISCNGWRLVFSGVIEENDLRSSLIEAMEDNCGIADDGKSQTLNTIDSARKEVMKELGLPEWQKPEVEGFVLTDDELARICLKGNHPVQDPISDGFRINGVGSVDGKIGWGLAIDFKTVSGRLPWVFSNADLISRNISFLMPLQDASFSINKRKVEDFIEFLGKAFKNRKMRVINHEEEPMLFPNKTGWLDDLPYYVMPNEVIPSNPKIVPNIAELKNVYSKKGSREEWMKIAKWAVKNPPYTFGICLALAPVLLPFSGIDTGTIFHPVNDSTAGKTLMVHIAASIWGPEEKQKSSWKDTRNNVASVGCARNHNICILDEIGDNNDAKEVGKIVYTLTNGQGRGKNDINDHAKERKTWRCFVLSSGELTLDAILKSAGLKGATGGQQVRFVPIRIDKSLYGSLHGFKDGQDIVREIKLVTEKNYGWIGPEFVKWVAEHYDLVVETVPKALPNFMDKLLPPGCHDQIKRTAQSFALIVIAGMMAQHCGILPKEIEVLEDIKAMCDIWLANRGSTSESAESANIVRNVRQYISMYSDSKFAKASNGSRVPGYNVPEIRGYKETVSSRNGITTRYFIEPDNLRHMAQYENIDAIAEALDKAGLLYGTPTQKKTQAKSKSKTVQRSFDGNKVRYYEIVFSDEEIKTEYNEEVDGLVQMDDAL